MGPYEGNEEAYSAFWARKHELVKDSACCIDTHCHHECSMPFVAITALYRCAHRGHPKVIAPLKIEADWDEKLRAFCELMDLPFRQPQWWLASYWG